MWGVENPGAPVLSRSQRGDIGSKFLLGRSGLDQGKAGANVCQSASLPQLLFPQLTVGLRLVGKPVKTFKVPRKVDVSSPDSSWPQFSVTNWTATVSLLYFPRYPALQGTCGHLRTLHSTPANSQTASQVPLAGRPRPTFPAAPFAALGGRALCSSLPRVSAQPRTGTVQMSLASSLRPGASLVLHYNPSGCPSSLLSRNLCGKRLPLLKGGWTTSIKSRDQMRGSRITGR